MKRKALSIILILLIIAHSWSCTKSKPIEKTNFLDETASDQTTLDNSKTLPWQYYVVAVAVFVYITQGQWYHTETYKPDGTIIIEEGCRGLIGTCHARMTLQSNGNDITSASEDDGYDYVLQGLLAKTNTGKIVLEISNSNVSTSDFDCFFYDDQIQIGKPLIVDNISVLQSFNRSTPITIQGSYDVYNSSDGKYIILE